MPNWFSDLFADNRGNDRRNYEISDNFWVNEKTHSDGSSDIFTSSKSPNVFDDPGHGHFSFDSSGNQTWAGRDHQD